MLIRIFFGKREIEIPVGKNLIALDLGANVGDVSIILLRLGYKVIAFEPHPNCVNFMERRLRKFIQEGRLILINSAISAQAGKANLLIANTSVQEEDKKVNPYDLFYTQRSSLISTKKDVSPDESFEVEKMAISDVFDKFGYIDFIKMDIEGSEYEVIEGLLQEENLKKWGSCLVETHAHKIPGLREQHNKIVDMIEAQKLKSRFDLNWI